MISGGLSSLVVLERELYLDSLTGLARFSGGRAYWMISGGLSSLVVLERELYLDLSTFTLSLLWLRLWVDCSLLSLTADPPGPGESQSRSLDFLKDFRLNSLSM